jgi:hypothetical protein
MLLGGNRFQPRFRTTFWRVTNLSLLELPAHQHDVVHQLAGQVQQRGSPRAGDVRPTTAGSGVVINSVPSSGLR